MIEERQNIKGTIKLDTVKIYPVTQEKIVTPSKEIQEVLPDNNYDALSKVIINPYVPIVDKKTIIENGTYKASDDDLDGYSEVEVATTGVDINDYFLSVGSSYNGRAQSYLKKFPQIDTSNQTNFSQMFADCRFMIEISQIDTSKGITFYQMFSYCYELTTIPKINLQKATRIDYIVENSSKLKNIGGFENVGQAFQTTQTANNSTYELKLSFCPLLTHDSLMNVINNLYDIKTKGCKVQKLVLGSTNLAKLTAEEIAIATNKGWSVN